MKNEGEWLAAAKGVNVNFFTKDYFSANLSDAEMDRRCNLYNAYVSSILTDLKFLERELTRINFHDARIFRIRKKRKNLIIQGVTGDLQNGYQYFKLKFHGGEITKKIKKFNCLDAEFEIGKGQFLLHLITDKLEEFDVAFEKISFIKLQEITEKNYFSIKI